MSQALEPQTQPQVPQAPPSEKHRRTWVNANGVILDLCTGRRHGKNSNGGLCNSVALSGTDFCRAHTVGLRPERHAADDFTKEIQALKRFINRLSNSNVTNPKLINTANDILKLARNIQDSFKNQLTREKVRQLGFNFGTILFNYIPDGSRYEIAKKDFLAYAKDAGLYTPEEAKEVCK